MQAPGPRSEPVRSDPAAPDVPRRSGPGPRTCPAFSLQTLGRAGVGLPAPGRTRVPGLSWAGRLTYFFQKLHCNVDEVVGGLNKTTVTVLVIVVKHLLCFSSLNVGMLG